tara:strand:- start:779 stop:1714 length:936 start_codon:yes stop_codon:yes gene_type:complete
MNKLTKIGLTALAGSLVAGTVNAAEMSVTGSAGITFSGKDSSEVTGNGFTMGDSLTFSASGDVNDIGVTLSYELDGQGAATDTFDDHSITLDFGDAGTLIFAGHGGSSAMSARDDVMPTAKEEPWDVVTGADAGIINGASGENMFNYKYSHDSGFMLQAAYLPSSATMAESYTDFAVEYTGVDGLRLGMAMGESEATAGTEIEEDTFFATYAMGGITIGLQMSEYDTSAATGDTESTGFGVSYQVNDDLTVSYGSHEIEKDGSDDQESSAIGVSYTMGSMSLSATMNKVDNVAHTSTSDLQAYEAGVTFSF